MLSIILLIIVIVIMVNMVKSGNKFRDDSQKIQIGMTAQDVVIIMGSPSYTKKHADGSYEYIYEKSEWKGMFRGGTQTRRMECVFSSEHILISVGKNNNCNRSGW